MYASRSNLYLQLMVNWLRKLISLQSAVCSSCKYAVCLEYKLRHAYYEKDRGIMDTTVDALFDLTPAVRYVAFYQDGNLFMHKRPGIGKATTRESDQYEELLVNPTVLTLTGKRGNIDCGGLEYIIVRYGNFYQFIAPTSNGHVSIAFGLEANPIVYADSILYLVSNYRVTPKGT